MFVAPYYPMARFDRRSSGPRRRVHYHVGGRPYPGDLVFDGLQPLLVASWQKVASKRILYICFLLDVTDLRAVPNRPGEYVYSGDLLRTGQNTSHPAPWDEP